MLSETIGYTYVKLGGSFITFKDKPFSVNYEALEKIIEILSRVINRVKLILGNGGGSFAHTIVEKYRDQPVDTLLSMCQDSTRRLNALIVNYLVQHGLRVTGLQTSALIVSSNGEYHVFTKPLEKALEKGLTPIVYGECIFSDKGYEILSTERVFSILAQYFRPERIVLLTDVSGIHTCDPKMCSEAELIPRITRDNLDQVLHVLETTSTRDATGSVYGKVLSMTRLSSELRVRVYIVSGFDVESSIKAILGEDGVYGTVIETY